VVSGGRPGSFVGETHLIYCLAADSPQSAEPSQRTRCEVCQTGCQDTSGECTSACGTGPSAIAAVFS
jgi:hypothetical protein